MVVHLLLCESLCVCVSSPLTHGAIGWCAIYVIVAFSGYTHLHLSCILQCFINLHYLNEVVAYFLHT